VIGMEIEKINNMSCSNSKVIASLFNTKRLVGSVSSQDSSKLNPLGPIDLARNWSIGLKMAIDTLRVITHKRVRTVIHLAWICKMTSEGNTYAFSTLSEVVIQDLRVVIRDLQVVIRDLQRKLFGL
jgi:hypothetical protein